MSIKEGMQDWIDKYGYSLKPEDLIAWLKSQGVVQKVECPDCTWSQFQDGESVGMTPCLSCNSTGYITKEID